MTERKPTKRKTAAKPRRKAPAKPRKPRAKKPASAAEEAALPNVVEEPLPAPVERAHFSSPVDLPEPATPLPRPLRWTTTVIFTATLLLALFNAAALRGWAYQLNENAVSARIVVVAEGWYDATAALGLDQPGVTVHGWWEALKTMRFGAPAEAPAATA